MRTQAVILSNYGGPENFKDDVIDLPNVQEDEVLIKVKATSFNPADKWVRTGAMLDFYPMDCPIVLGWDFAGEIIEVGADSAEWAVGDSVFGRLHAQKFGSYAHHVIVNKKYLAKKPKNLDYPQAAALALIGTTAYQALFDHAGLQTGEVVLIHGGAGGVGNMAVQLAKYTGATVIATAGTSDLAKYKI
ncbi:NADP-dependent oxidoreductase [Granulicatella seriolae]|uniref:NADP-dependent oxidoreductase n=1 Tax=Granulicatella seriolae TaxID=2967226 RepID=A0ABT1WPW4_9LACT|nr:NADP-dependent oxidoreductase [Granulicatella seriolae]